MAGKDYLNEVEKHDIFRRFKKMLEAIRSAIKVDEKDRHFLPRRTYWFKEIWATASRGNYIMFCTERVAHNFVIEGRRWASSEAVCYF